MPDDPAADNTSHDGRIDRLRSLLWAFSPHLLAATAFLIILVAATQLFPHHSANHDEGVYLQQAGMLLDGALTLQPPVEDAFRPWFFVDGGGLYPKYSPVVAAVYAIPLALGAPRLALAVVGAVIVVLTYAITRELFDRRTGLVAGALLLTSPLFVLDTATFLPYAPTTALNLTFAYAYLRAERAPTRQNTARSPATMWAALAGGAIGLAFFSRPYTAVLFAIPFVGHASYTLAAEGVRARRSASIPLISRRVTTAVFGLAGVGLALAYNWLLTGNAFVFPYEAFAPLDGLGFGRREILGHGIEYTPELAVRVNTEVLWHYLVGWAPLGAAGSVLAGIGLVATHHRWDWRRATVAGVFATVAVGNVYFWGNHNILGNLDAAGDGLIAILGPYYHFDLLLPSAVFAAVGIVTVGTRLRTLAQRDHSGRPTRVAFTVLLVLSVGVTGASTVTAFADPVQRNAGVTAEYEHAYAPFTGDDGPPNDAVVFLPTPYGPWLNHPFQELRNEPGFDGETVYALEGNEFAVLDAYPDREYYRYGYRGAWNPFDGKPITPVLQPVTSVTGETVTADLAVELPASTTSTSIRLATDDGYAYYTGPTAGGVRRFELAVNDSHTWLSGPNVAPAGNGTAPLGETDDVVLEINVNRPGGGFSYRVVFPVTVDDGQRRALTPSLEVCTTPARCGGEAAHVPGSRGADYSMNVTFRDT